jgi:hypothetical protein
LEDAQDARVFIEKAAVIVGLDNPEIIELHSLANKVTV